MSLLLQQEHEITSITPEIEQHPAWVGKVSALVVEKHLRKFQIPYLYVLRAGETQGAYYVTYIDPNAEHNKIVHRPFVITITSEGWVCENGGVHGPYVNATIDDVLHSIMHCEEGDCIPYIEE